MFSIALVVGRSGLPFNSPDNYTLPKSIDWRKKGAVTHVKDQTVCDAFRAFAAIGSLEGHNFRKTGKLVSLSEQNVVDCAQPSGINGCDSSLSATMGEVFEFIKKRGGIATEKLYPWFSKNYTGCCQYSPKYFGATLTNYVVLPFGDEKKLQEAIAREGPIAITLDYNYKFATYSGGIFYEQTCNDEGSNHAMVAVGFGTDENGVEYYVLKNSWGKLWGEDGYMRIIRNAQNHCGIASNAMYPVV